MENSLEKEALLRIANRLKAIAKELTDMTKSVSPDMTKSVSRDTPKSVSLAVEAIKPENGSAVWQAYSDAYEKRYGVKPPRNAKGNALCKQLVDRLGGDAIPVASFYVSHDNAYYINRGHSLGLLLQNAEILHTEWATGKLVTVQSAKNKDLRQHNAQAAMEYLRRKE